MEVSQKPKHRTNQVVLHSQSDNFNMSAISESDACSVSSDCVFCPSMSCNFFAGSHIRCMG